MIMRLLILHSSSKSSVASPRRILHFVYGPAALPEGLRWSPLSASEKSAEAGSGRAIALAEMPTRPLAACMKSV
jgi:hypothetical protein